VANEKKKKAKSVKTDSNGIKPGQDKKGRFTKGNKLGQGNPAIRKTAHYRTLFREAITDDMFKDVLLTLYKKAKGGDTQAIKIIVEHGMGKPQQYVEVSGDDNDPVVTDFKFTVVND